MEKINVSEVMEEEFKTYEKRSIKRTSGQNRTDFVC